MSEWYVVKAEALDTLAWGFLSENETNDIVSSAIPVEPADLYDGDTINAWPNGRGVKAFVPVESSSSGEGGDQWPEATGASAAEREEVAPSEPALLVAEAPEGTQPPGLSDGDQR